MFSKAHSRNTEGAGLKGLLTHPTETEEAKAGVVGEEAALLDEVDQGRERPVERRQEVRRARHLGCNKWKVWLGRIAGSAGLSGRISGIRQKKADI